MSYVMYMRCLDSCLKGRVKVTQKSHSKLMVFAKVCIRMQQQGHSWIRVFLLVYRLMDKFNMEYGTGLKLWLEVHDWFWPGFVFEVKKLKM